MARIPEETIQQVLSATNIVDLVGRYVKLTRAGTEYKGLCPFHTEKSPSFGVNPVRGFYHCFGCGAGGNASRFLMEHDGLSFVEAIMRLAEAAGIRIEPEAWDANAEREAKLRKDLKLVHEELAVFYHDQLLRKKVADAARQYLKSRGMNSDVAKNWLLGYAPEHDSHIRRWAADHRFSEQLLVDSGVFKRSDYGSPYPLWRHRLMIPIRDENGAIVAFSGRVLSPDAKGGKYVNSPETPIFSKSKILFGFDKSKRAIQKAERAVVIEGQIDFITTFEAGVQNIVATQGTAFTEPHAKMLKRFASEVVLCFDADGAGFNAAEKSFKILSPVGINVKVATLPKGEDPDSLIRKQGADAFSAVIARAVDFLDFQISHKRSTQGTDIRHQVQLIEQTAVTIAMNPSISARDLMIRSHSGSLGVSEDALRKQVDQFVRRRQKGEEDAPKQVTTVEEGRRLLASQHKHALLLVSMVLAKPEVLEWLRDQDIEELLHDLPGTELLQQVWLAHFPAGDEGALSAFFTSLSAAEEAAFTQLLAQAGPKGDIAEARHALDALHTARLLHLIQRAKGLMKQPDLSPERIHELHAQVMEWHKEYLSRSTQNRTIR